MTEERIERARLKKLLLRLIDIYSPSGKEEGILEYLSGYLKRQGIPCRRQAVDEHRWNLVVASSDDNIELALVGHVDTVSAYDLEAYMAEEEGGEIHGLGTADMKGGCAAMIEAYLAFWRQASPRMRERAALALVVGEEEEGDGARTLTREFEFPWAVIGEPTDLKPCSSHYGYLEVQITAQGRRRHASLAREGQNAVEAMLRLLLALTGHLESRHPALIYNIRDLWTTQAGFSVPEFCEAWLDLHLPPTAGVGKIMAELEDLVGGENQTQTGAEISLRFATIDAGFELPDKGPVLGALRSIYEHRGLEWTLEAFPSHSDASRFWEAGIRPIILGPGLLSKAHSAEESVSFEQVCLAAEIYLDLLLQIAETT